MQLPKILIINEAFNTHTGGGITLSNLFKGYDKDKIAVVCQSYLLNDVDTSVCDTYYQIGSKERKFIFPFNLINKNHYSGLLNIKKKFIAEQPLATKKVRFKLITNYFMPFLKSLGLGTKLFRTVISTELRKWIDEYKPDIIYAQAHDRTGINLVLQIHDYLNKPMVFHMMDDWVTMSETYLFKRRELKENDNLFKQLIARSVYLMGISEEMLIEYKNRYNRAFIAFNNPIDITFWSKFQRKDYEIGNIATLLYAGRLGLGIDKSLQLVAEAIKMINDAGGAINVNLVLQTKDTPSWINNYSHIVHRSFVEYEDLPKSFSQADLLLLPYDFSVKSLQFIGFSMPTKATEYMISGTPIIIFAPKISALVKYAEKYNWAKVVTNNTVKAVAEGINQLIENKSERETVARNAVSLAVNNHSSQNVTLAFRDALCKLSENNRTANVK